ncbi:hypothetical protein PVAP13_5NG632039 [Panicum virgatum]|uniref:Uncharacterized protein n=1 Tax=Panicum virgatum TaxID=38727 RepID=A0A8T0S9F3_PANVG|nr:hypothetical protein PVAP13_5NG632039 [Panicum virgatum]
MPLSGMIFNVKPNFTELWWHESNFPFVYCPFALDLLLQSSWRCSLATAVSVRSLLTSIVLLLPSGLKFSRRVFMGFFERTPTKRSTTREKEEKDACAPDNGWMSMDVAGAAWVGADHNYAHIGGASFEMASKRPWLCA